MPDRSDKTDWVQTAADLVSGDEERIRRHLPPWLFNEGEQSLERMNKRYELATAFAKEAYETDDVQIVSSETDAGSWFVESVDGGYWVEARVWVPADLVEQRLDPSRRPVIRRTFHGGTEDITWDEFVRSAIQDEDVARAIALGMIAGNDPYQYNANEPEFYEEFEIINRSALEEALDPGLAADRKFLRKFGNEDN